MFWFKFFKNNDLWYIIFSLFRFKWGEVYMKLFNEFKKMVYNFIKPYSINDPILKMPKNVRNMGIKIEILSLSMTIFSLVFAFVLKLTNMMIEQKLFLLGVILYMLYHGQSIIKDAFNIYSDSEYAKYNMIFDDELVLKGTNIIGVTKDKVLKYDENSKIYKVMSNEVILNTIRNYLNNLWTQQIKHRFDVLEMLSILMMIITAILTNTEVPNSLFIPLIVFFSVLSFLSSSYINLSRRSYYKKNREYNNEQSVIVNDLLRVPVIVNKDLDMRITRFKNTVTNSNKNIKHFYKKMNVTRFIMTIIETLSQYGIIIFYILNVKLDNLTLGSIALITATLVIAETAIGYTRRLVGSLDGNNERIVALEREAEDMKLILETYHNVNTIENNKVVDNIMIEPFTIKYLKGSENDIPFTLKSDDNIKINNGEVAILYGPSGSGKTTFMNMLTERIKLEKSTDIPTTSRFLMYDDKLRFGSLSIYEELFCDDDNPDLVKMKDILKNLHLWEEIEFNSKDVWQYMKEKKFDHSLSNGQKQRLILAKLLYFLDNDIDALILDECTSGLDDDDSLHIDACDVLEYIVRYANKDKKRIVIISTHQNIDKFKENINKDYKIRNFKFVKEDEFNYIKEFY